jgi:hypothetical protein
MAKLLTAYDRKRMARRDERWPESKDLIYNKREESGFCTVPRTLLLVSTLIRHLSKQDPSRVYLDLWMRQRDDGYVEVDDPQEMAAAAGLLGTRAVKSWREKLDELCRLGFIEFKEKGNQKYKYILILHPHDVVQRMHHENPAQIPDTWWSYFLTRIEDIGATLRWTPPKPKKKATGDDFSDFPGALEDEDDDLPF